MYYADIALESIRALTGLVSNWTRVLRTKRNFTPATDAKKLMEQKTILGVITDHRSISMEHDLLCKFVSVTEATESYRLINYSSSF